MLDTLKDFFGIEKRDESEEEYIEYDLLTEEKKKTKSTNISSTKIRNLPIANWSEQETAQLKEIFDQLHEADTHISETRQNTSRLGIETRLMLSDLRKQLG